MGLKPERETDIVKACLRCLALRGVLAWRNNTGALRTADRFVRFGAVGSADILGCLPGGRLLAVEVKRKGNKPTEAQASWLELVRAAGGLACVVTSVDELQRALEDAP